MTHYGAYDPFYPNGIIAAGGGNENFGIRFLTADRKDHRLLCEKKFPFRTVRIHSAKVEDHLDISWEVNGKRVHLSWDRLSDDALFGRVEFDEGLEIMAEMYLPWESRYDHTEWVNFTVQSPRIFAGEHICPYGTGKNNAILFAADKEPVKAMGYKHRH